MLGAVKRLVGAMMSERSLGQDVEWVGLLLPLEGLGQPPLEHFHFRLANMHSGPIVVFHIPQQPLVLVGLLQ